METRKEPTVQDATARAGAAQEEPGQEVTVEWAPFRLAPGVDEAALVAASAALQEHFLARQAGFLRRELLRGPGGLFVDLVHWRDRASAEAAMAQVASSSACAGYFALMAGSDVAAGSEVLHLERLARYAGGAR